MSRQSLGKRPSLVITKLSSRSIDLQPDTQKSVDIYPYEIRIVGAPRTKKSHNQMGKITHGKRKGDSIVLPSKQWRAWKVLARIVGNAGQGCDEYTWPLKGGELPMKDYNCRALFYRDARRGDAVGYYQGLADLLEKRGVIVNDSCITQWDGSRMLIDRDNPRVELTLTEVAA